MKKIIAAAILATTFSVSHVFAEETKTTTQTGNGTVETKTDTTHNPLTGNDTTTKEVVTKDAAGKETSKRVAKVKRDHKSGKMLKKTVESEKTEQH